MFPLILFACALAGAVLVQAFIRTLVPGRTWVGPGRTRVGSMTRALSLRPAQAKAEIGDWENEGGALGVIQRIASSPAPVRTDFDAPDHGAADKLKAA